MRFTFFGDNGWRLNCGAGDLLVGLNQADLAAPLGQSVEHVAAEMAIEEERHHRPQAFLIELVRYFIVMIDALNFYPVFRWDKE